MLTRKAISSGFVKVACARFLLALTGTASAEEGWVKGYWQFWQKNGNYCPTGRDCTGANYVQSEYDKRQYLKNAEVRILHDTAGIIGQGWTDSTGYYAVKWSYNGTLPSKGSTRVQVLTIHGTGPEAGSNFRISNASGGTINNVTSYFTVEAGTTSSAPQNRGTFCVGGCTSATASGYYNAFWGMEMIWRTQARFSGWFAKYLHNTQVRGFQDEIPGFNGTCRTSCASGGSLTSGGQIQLDAAAQFSPQGRIMHEWGHIASGVSRTWSGPGSFRKYAKGGNDGWNNWSDEHGMAAWEEGLATFFADSTLYNRNAITPTTCLSVAACSATDANIETSSGATCPAGQAGWPLNQMRMFWDAYDSRNDTETLSEPWWRMFRILEHYPAGTGTNQNDEPWNSLYTAITEPDGRASRSWVANYQTSYGVDLTPARTRNCTPP